MPGDRALDGAEMRPAGAGGWGWRETGRAPSAASSSSRSSRKCTLALTHRRSAPPEALQLHGAQAAEQVQRRHVELRAVKLLLHTWSGSGSRSGLGLGFGFGFGSGSGSGLGLGV